MAHGWAQATSEAGGQAISYQGKLVRGGQASNGSHDFQFWLMDAATGGQALGTVITNALMVKQGVFTASLAFAPDLFTGASRWIEVRVRPTASGGVASGDYVVLERQKVQFAPYAYRAMTASTVTTVPVQSLPASVPLKNSEGKLDSGLIGGDIARTGDVASLAQTVQQAQALIQTQATILAQLQTQVATLTQENAALRQSVESAAAPTRSGWMVASLDPMDPTLMGAGFTRAFSTPEPSWRSGGVGTAPSARVESSAVWTGEEWLVWGGRTQGQVPLASGAGYRPATDAWVEVAAADAPEARSGHSAVWTGTEMIVWGGFGRGSLNNGGKFSRAKLAWGVVSTLNAPSGRQGHGAAWTGRRMVVFGGRSALGLLNDGGLYDPAADTWVALPTAQAPSARAGATVLWTGSGVLVWGGETLSGGDATGAFLRCDSSGNPVAWEPLPLLAGFEGRTGHVAAWDGRRFMVWGGRNMTRQVLSDGAMLDMETKTWSRISVTGAPSARSHAIGAWTGDEFLVFGGQDAGGPVLGGSAWRVSSGTWRTLPSASPAIARAGGVSAWTGSELLVFGGQGSASAAPIGQLQRLAASPPWHFFRRSPN
jgi:N-acetylneuraminic acid mutarotase